MALPGWLAAGCWGAAEPSHGTEQRRARSARALCPAPVRCPASLDPARPGPTRCACAPLQSWLQRLQACCLPAAYRAACVAGCLTCRMTSRQAERHSSSLLNVTRQQHHI